MERIEFNVEEEDQGIRIDQYLTDAMDGVSRSRVQKWIKQGAITTQTGKSIKKNYILTLGDTITVEVPEPEVWKIEPEQMELEIIYEDSDVIVVNKPKGLVVHPAPGNYTGTLVNGLMYHIKDLSDIGGVIRPGIVHRIDKDTTGLLMVAKNNKAHESLSAQLKDHSVERRYYAIVHGGFSNDAGTIDKPIGRHPKNRLKQAVTEINSKHAITHYEVIERLQSYTLISCRLETGRTHQIRVHMASIGHPLLGDPLYGVRKEKMKLSGQLLHAETLGFDHPTTGARMVFQAPLPERFVNILEKLR
ncbi:MULTISPECIES: RluA family pseudouridine synthase [unclassified Fusibacter]|uniref:RluA family pseudouridine synthase n=1 Tax=unclassified Fusibacter TaxID=2624464 RepID=UPI001010D471|nr:MULTISPECIES: RluA family pseudouridine synthase [unclassified Fusibacter]MCK8058033.1 RluA family pseudouridine synthase [Fusibacter sp. A2]NPE20615.1 RluA family pseudouridine synthase [Fusibacter sp. A1]RXV62822.1 RluA family pseudouridine synthase [Fusibacter sp. A1]